MSPATAKIEAGAQAPAFPPLPPVEMVAVKNLHYDTRIVEPSEAEIQQLAAILQADGAMHNPITVIRYAPGTKLHRRSGWPDSADHLMRIIDGATRANAAMLLGWAEIPARVYPADSLTEAQLRYMEARANLTRRNLPTLSKYMLHLEEMEAGQKAGVYSKQGRPEKAGNSQPLLDWYEEAEKQYGIGKARAQEWFAVIRVLKNDHSAHTGFDILGVIQSTWGVWDQSNLAVLERLAAKCSAVPKDKGDTERKNQFKPIIEAIKHFGGREAELDQGAETIIAEIKAKGIVKAKANGAGGKPKSAMPPDRSGTKIGKALTALEKAGSKGMAPTEMAKAGGLQSAAGLDRQVTTGEMVKRDGRYYAPKYAEPAAANIPAPPAPPCNAPANIATQVTIEPSVTSSVADREPLKEAVWIAFRAYLAANGSSAAAALARELHQSACEETS